MKRIIIKVVKGMVFISAIFLASIYKLFNRHIWLVGERGDDARDNAYWFFKYLVENLPEQKAFYVIKKNSADYKKVSTIGKTIEYKSFRNIIMYFAAEKIITTHPQNQKPSGIVLKLEKKKLLKNKTYFLQHGVTKERVQFYLNDAIELRLFVTSAKPEFEFVKKEFGFDPQIVKLCGFPRFDQLHNCTINKNHIVVMPTWRVFIRDEIKKGTLKFEDTDFYKNWNAFLHDDELLGFLKETNSKLFFYLHKEMQPYFNCFKNESKNIVIADFDRFDVQTLLKESEILITDYSSVAFDFFYMKKPVIFYQFDYDDFRKNHYKEGYFDYKNNQFSISVSTKKEVVGMLKSSYKNKYKISKETNDAIDKFFPIRDNNNCERCYNLIKEM